MKTLNLIKPISMKEFVNDIQNLIVKHWGKLILLSVLVFFIVSFTFNSYKSNICLVSKLGGF